MKTSTNSLGNDDNAELERLILEGLVSPVSEMTPADWAEIRRQGYERLANDRRNKALAELERLLLEGVNSPLGTLNKDEWESMRQEALSKRSANSVS